MERVLLSLRVAAVATAVSLPFGIVVAGNVPGRTQTVPLAIFAWLIQAGGEAATLRLVAISVLLSLGSLLAYTLLTRRLHRSGRSP